MISNTHDSIPLETLKNRKNLATLAICVLWAGAAIAIAAVIYRYIKADVFETATLVVTVIALFLSIPVIMNRKRLSKAIETRN